ncbi:MAG: hypothetical protein KAQ87_02895 [Candidatus Pacebacteria bacterium]|nr:hypothetical protein [Candidatus Paceibacterota bacterium]
MTPLEKAKQGIEEKRKAEELKRAIDSKLKHIGHLAGLKDIKGLEELDLSLSEICDFYSENSEEDLLELTKKN